MGSLLTTELGAGSEENGELDGVYLVASSSTRQRLGTSAQKGAHTHRAARTPTIWKRSRAFTLHSPTSNAKSKVVEVTTSYIGCYGRVTNGSNSRDAHAENAGYIGVVWARVPSVVGLSVVR